jgi:hypothetical protein
MLSTVRLQERREPYILNVELARARLGQIAQKKEDWGLYDYPGTEELDRLVEEAMNHFVAAMKLQDNPPAASLEADQALALAVSASEALALFHARVFIDRRLATANSSLVQFGCWVDMHGTNKAYRQRLREAFDFCHLPLSWKQIEPKEQEFNWSAPDLWVDWLTRQGVPIKMGPLTCFSQHLLPDWIYIWENNFDNVRDLIYEHIGRIVKRYGSRVSMWGVATGIHSHNTFKFNFEQLIELTRMAATLAKKLAPDSTTLIELDCPFGEYYARNQRTIPPLLYADMTVQSGISFDGFGLHFYYGVPEDGMYVRDLMAISALLDQFSNFGKPVHITACQVPSNNTPDSWDFWAGAKVPSEAGYWRREWDEHIQAQWLENFYRIAASKPFVESICWRDLADYEGHYLPHGGLLNGDLTPKPAYQNHLRVREDLNRSAVRRQVK